MNIAHIQKGMNENEYLLHFEDMHSVPYPYLQIKDDERGRAEVKI